MIQLFKLDFWVNNPKKIFLLDGIGALISSISLIILMAPYHVFFGMPLHIVHKLALIPVVFAVYSFCCYYLLNLHWKPFLLIIGLANFSYCILTSYYMCEFWTQLTLFGILYFILESLIVLSLVALEFYLIINSKSSTSLN
jgi:hypothetical protein